MISTVDPGQVSGQHLVVIQHHHQTHKGEMITVIIMQQLHRADS